MNGALRYLPNYTYEDYLHWEGRWEVIDGIPYAMSPMPSPYHQEIGGALIELLRVAIRAQECNCKVYQPIDVKINNNTIVNPDVIVLCDEVTGQVVEFPPSLVIEILSPSTQLKDRHTKYQLYQEFGIPYYLIVDLESQAVEVYRNSEDGYVQQSEDIELKLDQNCSIQLDFQSIWQ